MKYSIIMPYYKRITLHNTLISYKHFYGDRSDYEVIIVSDPKQTDDDYNKLVDITKRFDSINIQIIKSKHSGYNPAPAFNLAAGHADGKFLMITNPECFHTVDILGGADKILDKFPNKYIICGCLQVLSMDEQIEQFEDFKFIPAVFKVNAQYDSPTGDILTIGDELKDVEFLEWYQHSIHCNRSLHFCTILSASNYQRIGGFDENYSRGIGWEDNDFFETVCHNNIITYMADELLVYHQFHNRVYQTENINLSELNYKYFRKKWEKNSRGIENRRRQTRLRNQNRIKKTIKNRKNTSYIRSRRGRN